ncbi:MAG: TIGR03905 family TSCPD domain-containing protein [Lachnospiraceae bacterium]|nr:TIGR03905 family TSCPD domain-containing protein [Lachnospiraceae bacterium]
MEYIYNTTGTCSKQIQLNVEEGVIKDVQFLGGCNGNLQGISKLVKGQKVKDIIDKLQGIKCGMKDTSCPDQLSKALSAIIEKESI